jgi:site-specific DNA-cytosine methylase
VAPTLQAEHGRGGGVPTIAFPQNLSATQRATTENLAPAMGSKNPLAVAFSCKDHGADAQYDLSPTLRSGNFDQSHMNGGVPPAVAFKPSHYTRGKDGAPAETMPPLSAEADKGDQEPVIYQWASGGGNDLKDTAQALRANAEHSYQVAMQAMAVRRLTPTECERLQGLPDGHTAGFSDSTRYRMLGNAVCVPVAQFILRRLVNSVDRKDAIGDK